MTLLNAFGPRIWIADGPHVNFFGFELPSRSAIVQLSDNTAWLWSPIAYSEELAREIEQTVGPISYLVSPNKIHWLFLDEWKQHYPNAKLYASPGLQARRVAKALKVDATLGEEADPAFVKDLDQVIFRGGVLDEVVFFHRASNTVIFADLIQRNDVSHMPAWKAWLMEVDDLVGPNGSTPREWRLSFCLTGNLEKAKQTLQTIVDHWKPERLIIAHGQCATEHATEIVKFNLRWMQPIREKCGCIPWSGQMNQEQHDSKDD